MNFQNTLPLKALGAMRPVQAVRAMGTLGVGTPWLPTYAPIHPAVPVVYYYVKPF